MSKTKFVVSIIVIIVVFIIAFLGFGVVFSDRLEIEKIRLDAKDNSGVKISVLHISDLHYPKNEISLDDLTSEIDLLSPDLIFLTGDMVDSSTEREDVEGLSSFFEYLGEKSKTYAVIGNHETINSSLQLFKSSLAENNIVLLENDFEIIQIKTKQIAVVGISDNFEYNNLNIPSLNTITCPIMLLAHRPEKFSEYVSYQNPPLVTFSGHAHGGQFKFFGKGMFAPAQGFFPTYFDGLYEENDRYMVVSRGLGNSIIPLRLYNKNHMPYVEIYL